MAVLEFPDVTELPAGAAAAIAADLGLSDASQVTVTVTSSSTSASTSRRALLQEQQAGAAPMTVTVTLVPPDGSTAFAAGEAEALKASLVSQQLPSLQALLTADDVTVVSVVTPAEARAAAQPPSAAPTAAAAGGGGGGDDGGAGGGGGDDQLATGAIIGIVCGSFAVLSVFVYGVANFLKSRRQVTDDNESVSSA